MNAKAIQRVEEDKRAALKRRKLADAEAVRLAQIRAEQIAVKAENERSERERPFNDEVSRRLSEYQTKQKGDN